MEGTRRLWQLRPVNGRGRARHKSSYINPQVPAWVPAGATNHFQRQIEAASINKSSSLQEVTFNVNDDYEQVTISESSEVKVVIPEAAPLNTSGHQFDSAPISMISVQEAVKKFETIQPSEYYGNSGGLWEVSDSIRSRLNWTVVSGLIWTMNKVTPCDPYEKEGISRPLSPSVSDVVTQLETRGEITRNHSQEGVSFSNGIRHKQEDIRATLKRASQTKITTTTTKTTTQATVTLINTSSESNLIGNGKSDLNLPTTNRSRDNFGGGSDFILSPIGGYNWVLDQLEEQLEEVMVAPNPDYQKKSQSEAPSYFGSFERTLELAYRLNMGLTHKAITRIAAKIRPNRNTYNKNI